jgi:hypothetical protein
VKPEVVAHTLSPAALMMVALSMWPVPTRLRGNMLARAREAGGPRGRVRRAAGRAVVRTWSQRMLETRAVSLGDGKARTATTRREGADGMGGDGLQAPGGVPYLAKTWWLLDVGGRTGRDKQRVGVRRRFVTGE